MSLWRDKRTTTGQLTNELFGIPLDIKVLNRQVGALADRMRNCPAATEDDLYKHIRCVEVPARVQIMDSPLLPTALPVSRSTRELQLSAAARKDYFVISATATVLLAHFWISALDWSVLVTSTDGAGFSFRAGREASDFLVQATSLI